MNLHELRDLCARDEYVILTLPWQSRGQRTRLFRTTGPLGTIRCVNRSGKTVACFKSKAIIRHLNKLTAEQS